MKDGRRTSARHRDRIQVYVWRGLAEHAEIKSAYVLSIVRDLAERVPAAGARTAERFQKENGFSSVIRDIRRLIEQRSRQILVSFEAELA